MKCGKYKYKTYLILLIHFTVTDKMPYLFDSDGSEIILYNCDN